MCVFVLRERKGGVKGKRVFVEGSHELRKISRLCLCVRILLISSIGQLCKMAFQVRTANECIKAFRFVDMSENLERFDE